MDKIEVIRKFREDREKTLTSYPKYYAKEMVRITSEHRTMIEYLSHTNQLGKWKEFASNYIVQEKDPKPLNTIQGE